MIADIKNVEIRQATLEDIKEFYPDGPPQTSYSWLALYNGIPACLAGLTIARGGCIAFSDIKPGIDAPKITIWRTAVALLERIKSLDLPIYAACAIHDKMSHAFVERLGFEYERKFQGVGLYKWKCSKRYFQSSLQSRPHISPAALL